MQNHIRCKICNTSTDIRKEINRLIDEGISSSIIISRFPDLKLNKVNIHRHNEHREKVTEESIEAHRMRKQLAKDWRTGNSDFLEEMRPKLEGLVRGAVELVENTLDECLDASESPRKMGESVNALQKLIDCLDSLSGIKAKVSLDAAIERISKDGYEVKQLIEEKVTDSRHEAFERYLKDKERANGQTKE